MPESLTNFDEFEQIGLDRGPVPDRLPPMLFLAALIHGNVRIFSFSNKVVEVPARTGMAGVDAIIDSQIHPASGVVVFFAQRSKPGLEEEMVNEIREMALAELQTDADEIKAEYDRIAERVMQIEEAISTLRGIGHGSTLSSLGPVVDLAVHALKSRHGGK